MIVDNLFRGFQKSGTKSRGVLLFVPLRRFYDVLFVPLFFRPREKCGTMWKTTWRHNVDNIRQKDIKNRVYESYGMMWPRKWLERDWFFLKIFGAFLTPKRFGGFLPHTNDQCGGSGMFIPDPTFFHPGSRIRTVSIPDPGSSSKNLSILTLKKAKKKWFQSTKKYEPGCSSRIRMLTFSHPGSRGQKGTQSRIRIRNTANDRFIVLLAPR